MLKFLDTAETAYTVLNGRNSLDNVQIVLKPSGQSENRPDSIKIIWTLLYQSEECWNCLDSVKTVQTVYTLSVQFKTI